MAIKYYEKYPQRWESPSQDYPQGAFKNLSALGEQDGSYLEEAWLNDQSGFFGALLRNAEMTPNGLVDTAQKSQFYDALLAVASKLIDTKISTKQDKLTFVGNGPEVMKRGAFGVGAEVVVGSDYDILDIQQYNTGFSWFWSISSINRPGNRNGYFYVNKTSNLYAVIEYTQDGGVTFKNVLLDGAWGGWFYVYDQKTLEIPVDQIFYFDSATPPAGYIARNGQAISQATMPKLFARYGANMPDDRNRVHRMTGTLAGEAGTTQEDQIREHVGSVGNVMFSSPDVFSSGVFSTTGGFDVNSGNSAPVMNGKVFYIKFGEGSETRVKSRIVIFCNKIQ